MNTPCYYLESKKLHVPELRKHAFLEKPDAGWEGHFWCCLTGAEYGPDDQVVNLVECSNCSRSCFKQK